MEPSIPITTETKLQARQSYTGSRLTSSQFETAWQITGIIDREIKKSGSFIEPLTDYARTFAGRNKLDASREEMVLRDIYAERYGQAMNQTREALLKRDAQYRETAQDEPLSRANSVIAMIHEGDTMPFYQALDTAAITMAQAHDITESCAKSLMKEAYEVEYKCSLYEAGKDVEAQFHKPVRDAERASRKMQAKQPERAGPSR